MICFAHSQSCCQADAMKHCGGYVASFGRLFHQSLGGGDALTSNKIIKMLP